MVEQDFAVMWYCKHQAAVCLQMRMMAKQQDFCVSQRSLHNAPIFRLLLKVAVNGTHQCDFINFCGQQCPTISKRVYLEMMRVASQRLWSVRVYELVIS